MKKTFIIEHLEQRLGKWCILEYKHISKIVEKNNLIFTNVINKKDKNKLAKFGKVIQQSVRELKLQNACVLDPEAKTTLIPKIAKRYSYFIFGGILGDFPPRRRTKKELTRFINAKPYNIGKEQMPTDNAIAVVNEIISGRPLSKMKFKDTIEVIKDNNKGIQESYVLPYRYLIKDKKPLISKQVVVYLKKKKGF
ncbi:MAG: RNA methyltransferase [Nanoarchaeota archaeon]